MRIVKFILSLAATLGLVYVLNSSFQTTAVPFPLPPLGQLFCPFTGFWQNAESVDGFTSKKLTFQALKGPAEIKFDDRLVPHIFTEHTEDAYFLQGYVMAKDRLWQMDFLTRFASGRLSEVLGESMLETDKIQRRRGLLFAAERAAKAWAKSVDYKYIEALSAGINTYIRTLKPKNYPIEFKLMGYEPEDWSPTKTALLVKYMAWMLAGRASDIEASNALQVFGESTFQFLFPEYNPKQSPIIPTGTPFNFGDSSNTNSTTAPIEMIGFIEHDLMEKPDPYLGSNNWAVAGKKTASGNPILCNDPHLRLTLPAIWYELQMHTPEMNVYGVGIPGMPGVVIGFNENIAWGQTNVGHDVMDWYRIQWADDAKTSYYVDGELQQIRELVEVIKVRGMENPVLDTVKYTTWGPVIYESDEHPKQDLAMRWLALDEPNTGEMSTFPLLNQGKNYQDYSEALIGYDVPAQNFVFAAKDGDIAIKANGKFPIKDKGQGRFIADGSRSLNAWKGWIPRSQVPQIKNPARGFVASANQHSTDPTYPYYYNASNFDDYRGRYLNRRLGKMDSITAADMMALQTDTYSLFAEEALPLLLKNLDTTSLNSLQKQVLQNLQAWDYRYEADQMAPVFLEHWWEAFYELTWDEMFVFEDSIPMLYPENWRTLDMIENAADNIFFDYKPTPEKETPIEIATQSFQKMCSAMDSLLSVPTHNWSKERNTNIQHLARLPAFSKKDIAIGGHKFSLNAMRSYAGPSWRMIIELGETVTAHGIYPGGQSGNPGSPYYLNMIDDWAAGKYYELFFMKNSTDDRQPLLFTLFCENTK